MSAPKRLCDTAGMDRDRWLECRMHGPKGDIEYTIGGSDVSIIFGENPWTTPLELWRIKKGLMKPDQSGNEDQKEMGHMLEPIVAHWYGKKSDNLVIPDTGLYQHADYPYALANLDYRMQEPGGTKGVLECKTTNYHKAEDWSNDAVPYYYELQVRFYLAVMDLEIADICCLWGTNPAKDMATRRITRDSVKEAMIFERLDAFISSLRTSTPPSMADVNPKQALAALARIYGASKSGSPTIEFSTKQERSLRRIAALQAENTKHREIINNNEKEIIAHSVRIAEIMRDNEHGVLLTPADKIFVDYVTRTTHRPDSEKLRKDYPAIFDHVVKETQSRKIRVSVQAV